MAKILILDDNLDMLEMQAVYLRDAGHVVTLTSKAQEALSAIKNQTVDLLITDIVMPDVDGLEMIMKLRKLPTPIKIIAISGGGRINAKDHLKVATHLGAQRTLEKPFTGAVLCQTVDEVLKGSH